MTRNALNREYFDWMYSLVCDYRMPYKKLLNHLHSIEFTYTNPMDDNRASDGIDMRYRFADERNYDQRIIAEYLDDKPCSVLEMMVALANRCEEEIMDDFNVGNRTKQWFISMINSLGLKRMTDAMFDPAFVDEVIERFLNRDYAPNGQGGLFTVYGYKRDMRLVEIWYQMNWYLDEVSRKENDNF